MNSELKYDYSFNLSRSDFNPNDILFIYDVFNLHGIAASSEELSNFRDLSNKHFQVIQEKNLLFDHNVLHLKENIFLHGYWQSEKYFKGISRVIRDDFKIKKPVKNSNLDLADAIDRSESVSVHLRGRDYIKKESTSKIHNTCDRDYYERAMMYVTRFTKNPYFYIFSDDHDWAVSFLKNIKYPHEFVEGNSWNTHSYEDMRLMSLCKHNIIANSSFSWWSAWLNQNPNKIVVAPKKWFANPEMNRMTLDLVPENWVKI